MTQAQQTLMRWVDAVSYTHLADRLADQHRSRAGRTIRDDGQHLEHRHRNAVGAYGDHPHCLLYTSFAAM